MTSKPTGRRSAFVVATVVAVMLFFAPQLAAQQAARPSVFMVPNVAAGPEIPATKAAVWIDVLSEGFEGAFPTGAWFVFDYDGAFNGEHMWAADDFKPHSGTYSAWPAAAGANAVDPESGSYPDNCWTWMVYGPFDLSGSTGAQLQFFYWNLSEFGHDTLSWGASADGTSFDIAATISGDSLGWQLVNFNLASYVGDPSVWVAFIFQSDGSGTFQGPFVDDVVLQVTDPAMVFVDGFETGDTASWSSSVGEPPVPTDCNPIANTGCEGGDKCTFIVTSEDPFTGITGCADDGAVDVGGACSRDAGTGVDDCVGGSLCMNGICEEICSVNPNSCSSSYTCSHTTGFFEDENIGTCGPMCDLFAQDCTASETCYILLGPEGYPTVCAPTTSEPDTAHDGCEAVEKPVPQEHSECCSFINTCNVGLGCVQPNLVGDGLVCAEFCDPTGTVGTDDCFSQLGPGYHCLSINRFYTDVSDLADHYGFCLEEAVWGPAECYNQVQDVNEDGVDCCEDGGIPACSCAFSCG